LTRAEQTESFKKFLKEIPNSDLKKLSILWFKRLLKNSKASTDSSSGIICFSTTPLDFKSFGVCLSLINSTNNLTFGEELIKSASAEITGILLEVKKSAIIFC
jgi:hypothetical protein